MTEPAPGLADRVVDWMAAHRDGLDALMAQEGSRAIHEEFLLAEGGELPDRRTRLERARGASARAWLRHLARGLAATWPEAGEDLVARLERWTAGHGERLEALVLEEVAIAERRGASGDPEADRRDAELVAHGRLFAEALASEAALPWDEPPPAFGRRVGTYAREREPRRRAVEREARAAWGAEPAPEEGRFMTAAATREPDELRVAEAAAVWAHVRTLAEALERALSTPPEAPA